MTNLDALKSETEGLGLSDARLKLLLINRGLTPEEKYIPNQREFELAYAFALVDILKRPKSWSQGDMSESWDLDNLKSIATSIFNKYGVANPLGGEPEVIFL